MVSSSVFRTAKELLLGSLVTGIGYIGAKLAQLLLDSGEPVVALDNLFSTDHTAIDRLASHPRFTFIEGDVRHEADVRRAFTTGVPIETIYHLAAQSSSSPSAAAAGYTEETNLIGPRVVLDHACDADTSTFIFGGSMVTYGRKLQGEVDESHPYGPILDLSHLSKVHVEKLMEMYAINRGIQCVSARIGLVYGLGPVFKLDPKMMTAPNKFCLQTAMREPLRVDVTAYYPTGMIHVEDAARAMMVLAAYAKGEAGRVKGEVRGDTGAGGFRAVNVAGEVASVADVAAAVEKLASERGFEVRVDRPADRPSPHTVSFGSTASRLGFTPRRSLREGLAEVLDHLLATQSADLSPQSWTPATQKPELRTQNFSDSEDRE